MKMIYGLKTTSRLFFFRKNQKLQLCGKLTNSLLLVNKKYQEQRLILGVTVNFLEVHFLESNFLESHIKESHLLESVS